MKKKAKKKSFRSKTFSREKKGCFFCKEDIIIHTDSQYSIDCVTDWCHNWIKNGWKTSKGKDVLNKELIVDILNLMKDRNVLFKHVYAHIGIKHNERVDTLAKLGTLE